MLFRSSSMVATDILFMSKAGIYVWLLLSSIISTIMLRDSSILTESLMRRIGRLLLLAIYSADTGGIFSSKRLIMIFVVNISTKSIKRLDILSYQKFRLFK